MKIYLFRYGWEPGGPEGSVVIAENEEEAKKIAGISERHKRIDNTEDSSNVLEYSLQEIEAKPCEVYTGYYCC